MAHRSPGAARHRPPRHSPTRRAADHRRDHRLRRRHREQPREGASQHAHFQVRVGDAQSAELLVVVATCTHSRARPAQPAHALHSRRPRISNAHGRQTAVAAAAPRAHPPRTRLHARLGCSVPPAQAVIPLSSVRPSHRGVKNTNEYLYEYQRIPTSTPENPRIPTNTNENIRHP